MTIYEKLQNVKVDVLKANPKKSGRNKFSDYDYYELSDIMPPIIESCAKHKIYTCVSFGNEVATLTAINSEKPDEVVSIESPIRDLSIKGANAIQALGGVQTYMRRYLYMAMFDITENDMFDSTNTDRNPATTNPPKGNNKPAPQKTPDMAPAAIQSAPACEDCGQVIAGFGKMNATEMAGYTKQKYGRCLCSECAKKAAKQ